MSNHWRKWHMSELTEEQLVDLLLPHTLKDKADFWLHSHFRWLWLLFNIKYECLVCNNKHWRWDKKCYDAEWGGKNG